MSTMTLIRHGQASFFSADYDRLSAVGEEQSRSLGRYWGSHGYRFDAVVTGPRLRQKQTAECIGEAYRHAGGEWPEPIVQSGLDEYDLKGFIEHLAPALARQDSHFASLIDESKQDTTKSQRHLRSFQLMFERLLVHWQSESTLLANVESWTTFRQRVESSIREIQRNTLKGCRVAVVTSGGFIGTATQLVLGSPDRIALELNWRVLNSSLTEFVIDRDRMTLDRFNAVPHLPDRTHWTYR